MAVTVPCLSNLWGAGHAVAPADIAGQEGLLPMQIDLPASSGRTLTLTGATGTISYGGAVPSNDADGVSFTASPDRFYGGLAAPNIARQRHLSAVVLDDSEPMDPAPPALTMDMASPAFSVGLRQIFFVGDGLTGTGSGATQTFALPDEATRVFLGFMDSTAGISPGGYYDNSGDITGTLSVF
jgi:hypothetical protein